MLNEITARPIFGFTLCIVAYHIGVKTKTRFNHSLVNPLVIAALICIGVLAAFRIPLDNFMNGAGIITMYLAPTTAVLALSMYRQLEIIKKNIIPVLVGCTVGVISAILSVFLLCKVFGLSDEVTASLIPKSVTSAIATEVSAQLGGLVPVTVAAVTVTGVFGAVIVPYLVKWSHVNNPIAAGLAIGASSHALGTAKAMELGEVEGSLSGIAIGLCGLITVLFTAFL